MPTVEGLKYICSKYISQSDSILNCGHHLLQAVASYLPTNQVVAISFACQQLETAAVQAAVMLETTAASENSSSEAFVLLLIFPSSASLSPPCCTVQFSQLLTLKKLPEVMLSLVVAARDPEWSVTLGGIATPHICHSLYPPSLKNNLLSSFLSWGTGKSSGNRPRLAPNGT